MASLRVLFFRPQLGDGGADRVTLTLLHRLDRSRYEPHLALVSRAGVRVNDVPGDVPLIDLGQSRLLRAVVPLARAIRRVRPDVVVCTAGGANLIAVAAHVLSRSPSRLVLSERNAVARDVGLARRVLERPLKSLGYRHADLVTAVSAGVAQDLVDQLRLPRERVSVVYNPVVEDTHDALAAAPVEHPWFAGGEPVVLAVGRLVPQKDYPTLLAAFAKVRAEVPCRLAILGIGPQLDELKARVRSLDLEPHVAFLGFDPNPFRYMSRAAVMMQSSLAEGLPGTIIQAMASGTAVVATDCDHGPREVIQQGVDGFLVPVGSADQLAARVVALLRDANLRNRISEAARVNARRFSVIDSMRRYESAITGSHS